jgi:3-methyladenine DNA glycosylase AlkD
LQSQNYGNFTAKFIPIVPIEKILGIRTEVLRALAKELAQQADWEMQLVENKDIYMEETILHGLLIKHAKMPLEKRLELTTAFVPRINNWAVCDSFCYDVDKKGKPPFVDIYSAIFEIEQLLRYSFWYN